MISSKNFNDINGIPWNSWKKNFTSFTVYKIRWFILGVVSLLNFTNGMISTQYKVLVNETNAYFCADSGTNCSLEYLLELVVIIGFLVCAYPSIWICSKLKIRYSLFVAISFLLLSSILKVIASWKNFSSTFRFTVILLGQALSVPSHIIGLSIVPLVTQFWFPVGQRTFSTAIGIYTFFLGYLITFLTTPSIYSVQFFGNYINDTRTIVQSEHFLFLNGTPLILSIILLILTYFIRHSMPKTPSSASSGRQIFEDGQIFLFSPALFGQIVIFGLAFGAVQFLSISYNDYLCLNGYVMDFQPYYAFLILVGGLAGVFLFSVLVDHFQDYKRTYRSCFAIMSGSACLLGWAVLRTDETFYVLVSLGMFGVFGMATIFIGVEMAVETVYPMNQAIVGGTLFASGYLFHLIFIGMKYVVKRRVDLIDYKHQVCHKGGVEENIDYTTLPCLVGLVLIIGAILMLVCLQVKTRRRDYETNAKLMKISVFSIENPTFSGNFSRSIES